MGVTNQDISDRIDKAIEAMERIIIEMVQSNRELSAKNETEHAEFRRVLTDQAQILVLLRERQDRHAANWQTLWKLLVVPILGGIVVAVLALVLK